MKFTRNHLIAVMVLAVLVLVFRPLKSGFDYACCVRYSTSNQASFVCPAERPHYGGQGTNWLGPHVTCCKRQTQNPACPYK